MRARARGGRTLRAGAAPQRRPSSPVRRRRRDPAVVPRCRGRGRRDLDAGDARQSPGARAYAFEGAPTVAGKPLAKSQLALTTAGSSLAIEAGATNARLLVIGGAPLNEPVVHYGPFVMNTNAEIRQAISDYQSGRLTVAA